ncbi:MAG TPA: hypothetical protein VHE35_29155, partial [Kofleriaceae bacterium]|nr:hypothetical protein [Kofleriaceae bacterium]
ELDVPTADGSVPAVHAVAGGADLPMEPIAPPVPGDRVVRYRAQLEVPAFGWQAIDLVPGLPATPPAAVTLELLDGAGQPAAGDAVARVVLANAAVRSEWTRVDGRFALTSLVLGGHSVLAGPSMIVRDYHDDGGLWRLGHEMPGCAYTADPAGADHETVQVLEAGRLGARVAFVGADATREAALTAGADALDVAITTAAPLATTRTVDLALASTDPLSSSVPGGAAVRPGARVYAPTYWAAVSWARTGDVAVLLRQSTGARMDSPGALELMVARDARQEGCDVEGGTGTDTGVHRIEWRLVRAPDDAAADRQAQAFDRPLSIIATGAAPAGAGDLPAAGTLLSVVDGDGLVSAFKPADRGAGLVLRVLGRAPSRVRIDPLVPLAAAPTATAVDLAERDLDGAVPLTDRTVSFDPSQRGSIETVRLASP